MIAVVTGAAGQDGFLLARRLLTEGCEVHAVARTARDLEELQAAFPSLLTIRHGDLSDATFLTDLVREVRPDELYNLGGQSSVSQSFADPWTTWRTNADAVVVLLEAIRKHSPETRFYQASSTDMFGFVPGGAAHVAETSPLNPQSPYASAKAAAHLLCRSYREAYRLPIACGILSNHESRRRRAPFLTRKIADHVVAVRNGAASEPLRMGNLKIERDWGFAPDYIDGIIRILRQLEYRSDGGSDYRDYILATGTSQPVWKVIDAAFALIGEELQWDLGGDDPLRWRATFAKNGEPAVLTDGSLLRPSDPLSIRVDASRAKRELGWRPSEGLRPFLEDMIGAGAGVVVSGA